MLRAISWNQYLSFLGYSLVFYYLLIWLVLYKAKIPSRASFQFLYRGANASSTGMEPAQHVIEELKSCFTGIDTRADLLLSLQLKLENYNTYDDASFKSAINKFITAESKNKCSIHLSEEDLRGLWI